MKIRRSRRIVALASVLALAFSFFTVFNFFTDRSVAVAADTATCPTATRNVTDQVNLDFNHVELVDNENHPVTRVGDWWDLGLYLPWETQGHVSAGDYFTYDATILEVNAGMSILRPTPTRHFNVVSDNGVTVGCGTWDTNGMVTVVFNENAENAAQWSGHITTSGLVQYSGPGNETYTVRVGNRIERQLNMQRRTPGVAHYQKDGWIDLPADDSEGNENRAIMWRITLPAGPTSVTGASFVDEIPAGNSWFFDCPTVEAYVPAHSYTVTDPTTSQGLRQDNDTSHGAFGAATTLTCTPTKVTVQLPTIPAGESAIVLLPARLPGITRSSQVVGQYSNEVTFTVPGENLDPIRKVLRYGAAADAQAHQVFSVTKNVVGADPADVANLSFDLTITLSNAADPSVDRTFTAHIATGETYTYPTPLPLGTQVTISEGALPSDPMIQWNEGESRVFTTANGVNLTANNRVATFTLSEDHIFNLQLTNTVLPPAPAPTPTPSDTPVPSPSPSQPTTTLASTGSYAVGLAVLAGALALAGITLVIVRRAR